MKVSVVNSAGDSSCWNYATDTLYGNYASDNVCCIFAGFEVVLSVTEMLADLCYNYAARLFKPFEFGNGSKLDANFYISPAYVMSQTKRSICS